MAGVSTAVRARSGSRRASWRSTPTGGRRSAVELTFTNTADRPIQIGSHIHLADVNSGLDFDRRAAQGFRLDIPAGTSVRFEPGASRTVGIVALTGRSVPGLQIRPPGRH